MKILAINPGGTSTKIAVFEDKTQIFKENIIHLEKELLPFARVFDQLGLRKRLILEALDRQGLDASGLSCVVGRGGLMRPIPGGTYRVNERMLNDMKNAPYGEHPSNLGSVLAKAIGDEIGVDSYVVDPVSVDELTEVARITGIPELEWPSWFHALNQKAVARWTAEKIGKSYETSSLIVAHLGSGNSIVAHKNGQMVDGCGGRTNGPFSPERCGALPAYSLLELCYSGRFSEKELVKRISSTGGFYAYLGTKDAVEIERRIDGGDEKAELIYKAYIYGIAKSICSLAPVFEGKVDRIALTGGIAHSDKVVKELSRMTAFVAPAEVVAGEFEMEALCLGALRVLEGSESAKEY